MIYDDVAYWSVRRPHEAYYVTTFAPVLAAFMQDIFIKVKPAKVSVCISKSLMLTIVGDLLGSLCGSVIVNHKRM